MDAVAEVRRTTTARLYPDPHEAFRILLESVGIPLPPTQQVDNRDREPSEPPA